MAESSRWSEFLPSLFTSAGNKEAILEYIHSNAVRQAAYHEAEATYWKSIVDATASVKGQCEDGKSSTSESGQEDSGAVLKLLEQVKHAVSALGKTVEQQSIETQDQIKSLSEASLAAATANAAAAQAAAASAAAAAGAVGDEDVSVRDSISVPEADPPVPQEEDKSPPVPDSDATSAQPPPPKASSPRKPSSPTPRKPSAGAAPPKPFVKEEPLAKPVAKASPPKPEPKVNPASSSPGSPPKPSGAPMSFKEKMALAKRLEQEQNAADDAKRAKPRPKFSSKKLGSRGKMFEGIGPLAGGAPPGGRPPPSFAKPKAEKEEAPPPPSAAQDDDPPPPTPKAATAPPPSVPGKEYAIAGYDLLDAPGESTLTFPKGAKVEVISKKGEWWFVDLNGKQGYVPGNYFKPAEPEEEAQAPPPKVEAAPAPKEEGPPGHVKAVCLYDYDPGANQEHSISMKEGETIWVDPSVVPLDDPNEWRYVSKGGNSGYVPRDFIKVT